MQKTKDKAKDTYTKRARTVYTVEQLKVLKEEYNNHQYVNPEVRQSLSKRLQLEPEQIKVWFQNRRQKSRNKEKKFMETTVFADSTVISPQTAQASSSIMIPRQILGNSEMESIFLENRRRRESVLKAIQDGTISRQKNLSRHKIEQRFCPYLNRSQHLVSNHAKGGVGPYAIPQQSRMNMHQLPRLPLIPSCGPVPEYPSQMQGAFNPSVPNQFGLSPMMPPRISHHYQSNAYNMTPVQRGSQPQSVFKCKPTSQAHISQYVHLPNAVPQQQVHQSHQFPLPSAFPKKRDVSSSMAENPPNFFKQEIPGEHCQDPTSQLENSKSQGPYSFSNDVNNNQNQSNIYRKDNSTFDHLSNFTEAAVSMPSCSFTNKIPTTSFMPNYYSPYIYFDSSSQSLKPSCSFSTGPNFPTSSPVLNGNKALTNFHNNAYFHNSSNIRCSPTRSCSSSSLVCSNIPTDTSAFSRTNASLKLPNNIHSDGSSRIRNPPLRHYSSSANYKNFQVSSASANGQEALMPFQNNIDSGNASHFNKPLSYNSYPSIAGGHFQSSSAFKGSPFHNQTHQNPPSLAENITASDSTLDDIVELLNPTQGNHKTVHSSSDVLDVCSSRSSVENLVDQFKSVHDSGVFLPSDIPHFFEGPGSTPDNTEQITKHGWLDSDTFTEQFIKSNFQSQESDFKNRSSVVPQTSCNPTGNEFSSYPSNSNDFSSAQNLNNPTDMNCTLSNFKTEPQKLSSTPSYDQTTYAENQNMGNDFVDFLSETSDNFGHMLRNAIDIEK